MLAYAHEDFVRGCCDQHIHNSGGDGSAELCVSKQDNIYPFWFPGMSTNLVTSENNIPSDVVVSRWTKSIGC